MNYPIESKGKVWPSIRSHSVGQLNSSIETPRIDEDKLDTAEMQRRNKINDDTRTFILVFDVN